MVFMVFDVWCLLWPVVLRLNNGFSLRGSKKQCSILSFEFIAWPFLHTNILALLEPKKKPKASADMRRLHFWGQNLPPKKCAAWMYISRCATPRLLVVLNESFFSAAHWVTWCQVCLEQHLKRPISCEFININMTHMDWKGQKLQQSSVLRKLPELPARLQVGDSGNSGAQSACGRPPSRAVAAFWEYGPFKAAIAMVVLVPTLAPRKKSHPFYG